MAKAFDAAFCGCRVAPVIHSTEEPRPNHRFNLDTLEPVGEIPDAAANGVVVDPKSGHGFASSQPVSMFDAKTLKTIKTIDVQGRPGRHSLRSIQSACLHLQPHRAECNGYQCGHWLRAGNNRLGGEPEQAATDHNGKVCDMTCATRTTSL